MLIKIKELWWNLSQAGKGVDEQDQLQTPTPNKSEQPKKLIDELKEPSKTPSSTEITL